MFCYATVPKFLRVFTQYYCVHYDEYTHSLKVVSREAHVYSTQLVNRARARTKVRASWLSIEKSK